VTDRPFAARSCSAKALAEILGESLMALIAIIAFIVAILLLNTVEFGRPD
jgi:hypothetical protein